MLNLSYHTLQQVADKAIVDAAAHPRWIAAIGRALIELDCNPWIERGDMHGLIIGSPSGKCYVSNGICQCTAFEFKTPCWHRAAARLVRLHDEAKERQQYTQAADAGAFGPLPNADVFPLNLPDDDRVEESNRLARTIASARAKAQMAELFS